MQDTPFLNASFLFLSVEQLKEPHTSPLQWLSHCQTNKPNSNKTHSQNSRPRRSWGALSKLPQTRACRDMGCPCPENPASPRIRRIKVIACSKQSSQCNRPHSSLCSLQFATQNGIPGHNHSCRFAHLIIRCSNHSMILAVCSSSCSSPASKDWDGVKQFLEMLSSPICPNLRCLTRAG